MLPSGVLMVILGVLGVLSECEAKQPNIVFFVADDLGWNDVGWNNPGVKTPHMNKLAYEGVILNQSYVQPVCSPSRAAFLTGYYPFRTGLQHGVVQESQPYGLPLHFKLLPEKLKELGYDTHMIGKWHLGFCKWEYTPTYRGFDSFYGFYNGAADYFTHVQGAAHKRSGLDFRNGTKIVSDQHGVYSTNSYSKRALEILKHHNRSKPFFLYYPFQSVHSPLQVPRKYEEMYQHVKDHDRRVYLGMVTAMDDAVGRVYQALKQYRMLHNTLIVFTTDNGGAPHFGASNWPLRGAKTTLWEGGTRGAGFIYGKMLKQKGIVSNQLIHAVDWFPTFLVAAGGKPDPDIDGVNQWAPLRYGRASRRKEMIYNIDDVKSSEAIRVGDYKLILGSPGKYSDWYPDPSAAELKQSSLPRGNTSNENPGKKFVPKGEKNGSTTKFAINEGKFMKNPVRSLWHWFCCKTWSCKACKTKEVVKSVQKKRMKKKLIRNLSPKVSKLERTPWKGQTQQKVLNYMRKVVYRLESTPGIYLYNLKDDPLEVNNLSEKLPGVVKRLKTKLNRYREKLVPAFHVNREPLANPALYWGNVWSPGWC